MSAAAVVAAIGRFAVRLLVALHPRDFRRGFGATILDDTVADIDAAVPAGLGATAVVVSRAATDGARGVVVERMASVNGSRKAMQNAFASDLRHAVRTLARDRGFTAVALATLSIGLALCVTVAVLVNAYLLRGLPFPDSDRLFDVRYGSPGTPGPAGMEKLDWRSLDDILVGISWDLDNFNLRGGAYPESVQGTWVTPGYVEAFAVQPAIGRRFSDSDFEPGRPSVALIGHRLWQTRFNRDPAIVGRTFEAYVNDRPNEVETFTIVGVLAADHWHLNPFTEVLSPLRAPSHPYVVRLRSGVPPTVAADRITALVRNGSTGVADGLARRTGVNPCDLRSADSAAAPGRFDRHRPRAPDCLRQRRGAAHGSRHAPPAGDGGAAGSRRHAGQITRACAAEPLLLAVTAASLGLALAWTTIMAIAPVMDHYLGRGVPGGAAALAINGTATLVTVAVTLIVIGICAIVPILVGKRTPVSLALSGGQKGSTEGPAQRRARSILIAVEVAACLTLLVGAGLTIQSALGMLRVDMGLDAEDVLVGRFSLRQRAYPNAAARTEFYERVLARAGGLPGVQGIAFTTSWPLQAPPRATSVRVVPPLHSRPGPASSA